MYGFQASKHFEKALSTFCRFPLRLSRPHSHYILHMRRGKTHDKVSISTDTNSIREQEDRGK
jgi:hypothetical protein